MSGAPSSQSAFASGFRRLDGNAASFVTDGTRYAAWQYQRTSPIVVFDTRTGHRGEILDGCALAESGPYVTAAAGRFLVGCGHGAALLDVRTGALTMLPTGEYGPEWDAVGRRYVSGPAELHARCLRTKRHEGCIALYEIATGAVHKVPEAHVPDLDRPGAPPACAAFRHKLLRLNREELPVQFSYSEGALATTVQIGEAPVRELRVDRCHRRPTTLHIHAEPENIQLRGGILSWDTARPGDGYEEEEGPKEEAQLGRDTLTTYGLDTRRRRNWALPRLPLQTGQPQPVTGVFGYSAHTDYAVFWIAARSLSCDKTCNVGTSYVYEGRM